MKFFNQRTKTYVEAPDQSVVLSTYQRKGLTMYVVRYTYDGTVLTKFTNKQTFDELKRAQKAEYVHEQNENQN